VVWSRAAQEGQILPVQLPRHSCFKQEFPQENVASRAQGMLSNAQELKYWVLISIQTKIELVPKHLQMAGKGHSIICFFPERTGRSAKFSSPCKVSREILG